MEIGNGIIGKVLGAQDLVDGDGDGENKIASLVTMLEKLVKTLVVRTIFRKMMTSLNVFCKIIQQQ